MKSEQMWKEMHSDFDKLNDLEQVDKIARMLMKARKDSKERIKENEGSLNVDGSTSLTKDKRNKLVASVLLVESIEDVLVERLRENGGAEGNDFVIWNDKGNIIVDDAKEWR